VAAALRDPPISLTLSEEEIVQLLLLAAQSDVRADPTKVYVSFKEVMDLTDTGRNDRFLVAGLRNKVCTCPSMAGDAFRVLGLTQLLRQRHWTRGGEGDSCSEYELGQLLQGCGLVLSREELQMLALKAAPQDTARARVNASAMNTRAVSIAAAMTFIAGLVR
jgi:hypothetical protein